MSVPITGGLPTEASAAPTQIPGTSPAAVPLSRRPSRITSALTHAKSIDTHPPHHAHAHFDETTEDHHIGEAKAGPSRSPSHRGSGHGPGDVDEISPNGGGGVKGVVDIEHVPVDDDPREWSDLKKNLVLTMMTISVVSLSFLPDTM
jgi:hypothetical protein